MANPVGTGPYRLKEWRRGQKITLEANPNYREVYFPALPADADAASKAVAAQMKGKRMPQIGRIEISIIEESNPQLLAFNSGELEYANVPADLVPKVLDANNSLLPPLSKGRREPESRDAAGAAYSRISTWRIQSSAATRRRRSPFAARSSWASTRPISSRSGTRTRECRRRSRCRPTSAVTSPVSTSTRRTIRQPRGRSSTSSATRIATATASASCRTASRSR